MAVSVLCGTKCKLCLIDREVDLFWFSLFSAEFILLSDLSPCTSEQACPASAPCMLRVVFSASSDQSFHLVNFDRVFHWYFSIFRFLDATGRSVPDRISRPYITRSTHGARQGAFSVFLPVLNAGKWKYFAAVVSRRKELSTRNPNQLSEAPFSRTWRLADYERGNDMCNWELGNSYSFEIKAGLVGNVVLQVRVTENDSKL